MNRWLMAAVIGLMATGCAVGVEDPEPPPGALPGQRSNTPPAETFSAELQEISVTDPIATELALPEVPVDVQPMPGE